MNIRFATLAIASLLSLSAPFAFAAGGNAADGAIMIDQSKVSGGGVTNGDTAGFPLTISQNGRYRLTGNLVVPAGLDGIVVAAGVNAIIDMGGFTITGAATCSRAVNCFQPQGTYGIRLASGALVQVHDGRVRGFSAVGIGQTSGQSALLRLTDMHVHQNAYGVFASRLHALRVLAEDNAGIGIQGQHGAIIESNASENGNVGIVLAVGVVRGNVSYKNSYGYMLYSSMVATDNSAASNLAGALYGSGTPAGGNNAFVN